jgi:hypothetical protein
MKAARTCNVVAILFLVMPAVAQSMTPQRIALQKWYDANRFATVSLPSTASGGANAVLFDGVHVWASTNGGRLLRFSPNGGSSDPSSPMRFKEVVLSSLSPLTMAFDGRNVWVAGYDSGLVDKVDVVDGTVGTPTLCGGNAEGLVFDGTRIWLSHCAGTNPVGSSGGVQSITPATGPASSTYLMPGCCPQGITFDGTHLWVACWRANKLIKMDPVTGSQTDVPTSAWSTTGMTFDGTHVWAVNGGGTTITKVNTSTNSATAVQLSATQSVVSPRGVAFDGTYVWVTWQTVAPAKGWVSRIRVSDNQLKEYELGAGVTPRGVAFDGANIWIADTNASYACTGGTCARLFKF